jgi:RNA polymerase sigma-70 factor (ECF subfamily)
MGNAVHRLESNPAPEPNPQGAIAALVERVAAGDERALELFYDATSSRVFALALQILRDRSAAEDATLEVFTQVWKQAGRYDATKGTPLGWLLVLTRTRAIDLLRGRARASLREAPLDAALHLADLTSSPESQTSEGQDAARVRRALATLDPNQREALLAAYFGGLSHSEVATAFGRPLGTVKTHIRAGLQQLRRLLETSGENLS